MGMDGAGLSVADALALGKEDGGMFGGNGAMAIFFLFFLLAWGGGGFGFGGNAGANGALTRAEMQAGFDAQNAQMQSRGIMDGIYNGFYAQNNTLTNGFNSIGNQLNDNRFANQQCCCETNRNIDQVRYEAERNTCNLIEAGNANTQRIIDHLTQSTVQELRDKLQTAELELSNRIQTGSIIEAVRPFPIPSYNTCSPYTPSMPFYGGYYGGCGGYGYGYNNNGWNC